VPAVALTAYADEKNRTMALKSGFQQILVKPVEPLHLLTTLLALHATR
jgi:CheY-like chemotaxis protein